MNLRNSTGEEAKDLKLTEKNPKELFFMCSVGTKHRLEGIKRHYLEHGMETIIHKIHDSHTITYPSMK